MNHISDRCLHRSAGLSLDTEALQKYDDIIDLSIGDTDFTTDERIINAAMADAKAGFTHYGFPKGDPELIRAIAKAWQEDFRQDIPEEQILVTASSSMGMVLALEATVNPGDEVIVFSPYFTSYRQQIGLAGGVCVDVPLSAEDGYRVRSEQLESAITPKTRAIIINNPTNPSGASFTREDLQLIANSAEAHDLLVIADEIYTLFMYEGEFIPMRTILGMEQRTITLNSFSKNFMMTGWRVGYMIAAEEIINGASYINDGMIYTAPMPSQRAALAALPMRREIQQKYISRYESRVMTACQMIEQIPWMELVRPKGTFYIFPSIRQTGMTSAEFVQQALNQAHVMVSPGSVFGKAGESHFRIACTKPMEQIKEAITRIGERVRGKP